MIYLQQNNHAKRNRKRIIAGIFAFLVAIVILIQIFFSHFFPALITSVARPFWRAEFSVASGSLESPQSLLADNENLKIQLEEANLRLRTIQAIELENAELKSFFGKNINATGVARIIIGKQLNDEASVGACAGGVGSRVSKNLLGVHSEHAIGDVIAAAVVTRCAAHAGVT